MGGRGKLGVVVHRCGRMVWTVAVVALLAGALPACRPASRRQTGDAPSSGSDASGLVGSAAPGFSLLDQFGDRQSLASYRGDVVLLTFVSTRCKAICPLTAELLRETQDRLGKEAKGLQLIAINANYRYGAVHDVLRWSQQHEMVHRWLFLTGQAARLWDVYHAYDVTPGEAHTVVIFVIDRTGTVRALVPIAMKDTLDDEAAVLAKSVGELEARAA